MQRQRSCETPDTDKVFTISQVACLTGVSTKSIRYYESVGLLPRPARFNNGYRRYTKADVNRLILLRRIRYLGVPLTQAKSLLIEASDAQCMDVQQELLKVVEARLVALDIEIAELHRLREDVKNYQLQLADCHPDESEAFRTCVDMSCIAISKERSTLHGENRPV